MLAFFSTSCADIYAGMASCIWPSFLVVQPACIILLFVYVVTRRSSSSVVALHPILQYAAAAAAAAAAVMFPAAISYACIWKS